jgi:hypothetical protein
VPQRPSTATTASVAKAVKWFSLSQPKFACAGGAGVKASQVMAHSSSASAARHQRAVNACPVRADLSIGDIVMG